MLWLTAILTGLFGSFHCAGMCGPIAFALPGSRENGLGFYAGRTVYNLGRIFTYSLLGVVSGALGLSVKLAGIQQGLSIGIGVAMIAGVIWSTWIKPAASLNPFQWIPAAWLKKLFNDNSLKGPFLIGILNGFLPCGFVYMALLGATVTQDIWEGALFMFLFGMGTFPMMFGVSLLGQLLSSERRSRMRKLSPLLAILLASLFILRGLNLGIPYLSPQLQQQEQIEAECH